jgi:hypothetical protein
MRFKALLLKTLALGTLLSISFVLGYFKGKERAFESIITEECWLNNNTRDIECISYIGK